MKMILRESQATFPQKYSFLLKVIFHARNPWCRIRESDKIPVRSRDISEEQRNVVVQESNYIYFWFYLIIYYVWKILMLEFEFLEVEKYLFMLRHVNKDMTILTDKSLAAKTSF